MAVEDLVFQSAGSLFDVIVLPVASIENHGVLPVGSDYIIAKCTVNRLFERSPAIEPRVAVAPTIPYSNALEHADRGYTVAVPPAAFVEYLSWVIYGLSSMARSLVVAVFHGGASCSVFDSIRYARWRHGFDSVFLFSFWEQVNRVVGELGVDGVFHADPVEASILLACGASRGVKSAGEEEVLASQRSLKASLPYPWMGRDAGFLYPSLEVKASPGLGRKILDMVVDRLVDLISTAARRSSSGREALPG